MNDKVAAVVNSSDPPDSGAVGDCSESQASMSGTIATMVILTRADRDIGISSQAGRWVQDGWYIGVLHQVDIKQANPTDLVGNTMASPIGEAIVRPMSF